MVRKVIAFPSLLFGQVSDPGLGSSWSRHEEELGFSHLFHPLCPSRPFPPCSIGILLPFHLHFSLPPASPLLSFHIFYSLFFRLCLFSQLLSLSPCLAPSYVWPLICLSIPLYFLSLSSLSPSSLAFLQNCTVFQRPGLSSFSNFTFQHLVNVAAVYNCALLQLFSSLLPET